MIRYCNRKMMITANFLQLISTFFRTELSSASSSTASGLQPSEYIRDASGFLRIFFTYASTMKIATARKKFMITSLVKNAEYGVTPINIWVVACCAGPVPKPTSAAKVVTPNATIGSSFNFLENRIPIGTTAIRASVPPKPPR